MKTQINTQIEFITDTIKAMVAHCIKIGADTDMIGATVVRASHELNLPLDITIALFEREIKN